MAAKRTKELGILNRWDRTGTAETKVFDCFSATVSPPVVQVPYKSDAGPAAVDLEWATTAAVGINTAG